MGLRPSFHKESFSALLAVRGTITSFLQGKGDPEAEFNCNLSASQAQTQDVKSGGPLSDHFVHYTYYRWGN